MEQALFLAQNGHNFALLGQAGTGKTSTLQKIVQELEEQGKKVAVTCSTGIACQQYAHARTLHRYVLNRPIQVFKNVFFNK